MPGRISPSDRAIGVVVPSSNRVVERVTQDVLRLFPDVDACFTRIPYHGKGKGQPEHGYDEEAFLAAAGLLAHADVQAICWNGTRGAAMGFTPDRRLCAQVTAMTGLPAVSTALATLELLAQMNVRRLALVSQGTADYGGALNEQFGRHGVEIVLRHDLGITDNYAAARVDPARIATFAREAAATGAVDAVLVWSTNLPGHGIAASLEAELDLPVLDSCAIGVRACLLALGVDPRPAAELGRLFTVGAA